MHTKFSKVAYLCRFCEICQKELRKDEAVICKQCYYMYKEIGGAK